LTIERCDVQEAVAREFRTESIDRVGVAVSGGGDSVALLHAVSEYFRETTTLVFSATVNHGLRTEAIDEAQFCARISRKFNVPHSILNWTGWDGTGNLQEQARTARYALLTAWAQDNTLCWLLMAHTADDQAETLLMRLARSAGVDGLAGIPKRRRIDNLTIVRPFLECRRSDLRTYLRAQNVTWIDDPSNQDQHFERIQVRNALVTLQKLGITVQSLSNVAAHSRHARQSLNWCARIGAQTTTYLDCGDVLIDPEKFNQLPDELARRVFVRTLLWIGGGCYAPRRASVQTALDALRNQTSHTLNGCLLLPQDSQMRICREYEPVKDATVTADEIWDRRWRLSSATSVPEGCTIRALGEEGLQQCNNWRQTNRPRLALLGSPSLWKGSELLAAPYTGLTRDWTIELVSHYADFYSDDLWD